ncbi:MAG: hypothetical protein AAGE98_18640 [Actinomycetota bacterium]
MGKRRHARILVTRSFSGISTIDRVQGSIVTVLRRWLDSDLEWYVEVEYEGAPLVIPEAKVRYLELGPSHRLRVR